MAAPSELDLQKLAAAKLWLISAPPAVSTAPGSTAPRDLAYLTHALYALVPISNPRVATMSCDEWWRIYINPLWLAVAEVSDVGAQLAHMVWHLLSQHTERARSIGVDRSTAADWATAADCALAATLAADQVQPREFRRPGDLPAKPGLSAEQYFAVLSGLPPRPIDSDPNPSDQHLDERDGCGSGADGIERVFELGPARDVGVVTEFEAREIRRRVAIDYRTRARRRGHAAGDAMRWVQQVLEPTVSWQLLLASAVRSAFGWAAGRGHYTYARPSRRASSVPRVVLPGQQRPVPRVSIVVDTSGSVDDRMLSRALGEVDAVIATLGVPGSHVTLYSVDAAVHTAQRVRRARDARLVGAGGTDLRVGLRAIETERPRPDVVIVFTDGDTPWPATPPPGAVIVVALLRPTEESAQRVPTWAHLIECDDL